MARERTGSCETCSYWDQEDSSYTGTCLRYPPTYEGKHSEAGFPVVRWNWWCGEYHPKD